jgi:anti-anti-sigma factor
MPDTKTTGFTDEQDTTADLTSTSNPEEKQVMKSRIIPSIETASFQASVVEGETSSDECIVVLIGRIDHEQVRELENFLNRVIQKETTNLFCDIAGLTSINSSGWGLLVAEMQRLRKRGGSLFLCGLQGTVEQSFKVLELDKLFLTFRTVSEAMRYSSLDQEKIRQFPKPKIREDSPADNFSYLSLEEKIQRIVAADPMLSTSGICKVLRSDAYGKTQVSGWKLMSKLREMSLGTKEERYRFFRSS